MPNSLLELATQERDLFKTARDNARDRLGTAQAFLSAERKTLTDAIAQLQQYEEQIAALRAQLAAAAVPSDATVLLGELSTVTVQHRQQQATVLAARAGVGSAQASVASAQSMLELADARLTSAEARLAQATQEDARRQAWKTAVGQAPLATLRTDASNVLAGAGGSTVYAAAQAKFVPSIIPAKLWELATQRYTLWHERLKLARKAVEEAEAQRATLLDTSGGLAGKAEKQGVAFRLAERRLTEYALTGRDRYTRAVKLLQQLADPSNQVLTAAEAADVQEALGDRNDAADLEKPLNAAQIVLDARQAAYDDAVLAAYAKDPNDTNVSDDTGVVAAKGPRDTAETTRNDARNDFDANSRALLLAWAAVIPDRAWRQILTFLEATTLLNEVKDTPATLVADLNAAETAYANALLAEVKHSFSLAFLENAIATRKAMLESVQANQPTRLLSAIRGDDI
ncbi:coiled-coil domain-containing protein [Hyalangium gracile]|uniref:hypothetical protein n=1 Tax=Hyalangium gracile TaxID=394092 RepID=UPI001CCCD08D|nr:hypothetical protein [Hyalangium gracile]